jgi:hypothetical protein
MNETLIYTDSRPRAKSTGHAFGFEGNLRRRSFSNIQECLNRLKHWVEIRRKK